MGTAKTDYTEKRAFEREDVRIPFVYTRDEGKTLAEGVWVEAVTVDIGPVLVGGLSFETDVEMPIGDRLRVALFMDMKQRDVWARDPSNCPIVYDAEVVRFGKSETGQYRVGVAFDGFAGESIGLAQQSSSESETSDDA